MRRGGRRTACLAVGCGGGGGGEGEGQRIGKFDERPTILDKRMGSTAMVGTGVLFEPHSGILHVMFFDNPHTCYPNQNIEPTWIIIYSDRKFMNTLCDLLFCYDTMKLIIVQKFNLVSNNCGVGWDG